METEHPPQPEKPVQPEPPEQVVPPVQNGTGPNGQPGLGTAAKNFADHLSALVRLELELAQLEINRKIGLIAKGAIMAGIAAVLVLYMIGFALAAAAAGIATQTPVWVALLIVTGVLLLIAAILGLLAKSAIKKGAPPVPEQAIHEAKLTTEALKGDSHPEEAAEAVKDEVAEAKDEVAEAVKHDVGQ
jgi:uncharacterized membrane protein YqjE